MGLFYRFRTWLKLWSIALIPCVLSACGEAAITPGSPDYSLNETQFAEKARRAARGDRDAIQAIVDLTGSERDYSGRFATADYVYLTWADRLAKLNDVDGIDEAESARRRIAYDLPLDNPMRLVLLLEAQELDARATLLEPKEERQYRKGHAERLVREIAATEAALNKKYGTLTDKKVKTRP